MQAGTLKLHKTRSTYIS